MSTNLSESNDTAGPADASSIDAETIVRDNIGWMLALAERLLNDRGLAEDVVQESLISALGNLDTFRGASSLKTWLHRITTNNAISTLRKLNRLAEQSIDEYQPIFDRNDCRIEAPWTELASLPTLLEIEDVRNYVTNAINTLPESYRVVVWLRDIEGYDTAETADLLSISTNNVKVRLHRARAALKSILEPVLRGETQQ